jgi:hypothetical protein
MAWEVVEVVALPVHEKREVYPGIEADVPSGKVTRKEPGDTITKAEFQAHGQTDDDIKSLVKSKAIREVK